MHGTLILPDYLIDRAGDRPKLDWGARIVADHIDAVAPNEALRARYPHDTCWEARGQVLAPGFVDAHTHLYGVLAHGIPLDKAPSGFWPFLQDFWWPLVEDRLDQAMITAATAWNCAEMVRGGVTSFYDCTEAPNSQPGCLAAQAAVVEASGLRGVLSFEATERVSAENGELGLQENLGFIQACQNRRWSGRISGMMCFHTTFTCSAAFIRRAFDLAADAGARFHAHLSEGTHEPAEAMRRFGMRPVAYYEQLGVLGRQMVASQCVQVTSEEASLLAQRGVGVVHMPLSNCEVGGGIAPVPDYVKSGIPVALGSDGYITDFFEVMRGAFLIHKAQRQDPTVMPASLVWQMATENGAAVLGLPFVGRLAPGWHADMQLIDAELPTPLTAENLYEQLLLHRSRQHVRAVWVAGAVLVQDGQVVNADLASHHAAVQRAARRLWGRDG